MKAVILAAGMGTRLGERTKDMPKALIKVAGRTILERMAERLVKAGVEEIILTTGYREEMLREACSRLPGRFTFVPNPDYATTNNGYSLFLTREAVAGSSFLKFDGDMVFEEEVLARLLAGTHAGTLCLDRKPMLRPGDMKLYGMDDGRVSALSHTAEGVALGETMGMEKIDAAIMGPLFDALAAMAATEDGRNQYYEYAYQRLVREGYDFGYVDITGLRFEEIDDEKDLLRAERMLAV